MTIETARRASLEFVCVFEQDGDGFLLGKRYLIHDPLFTEAVRELLRDSGVRPVWCK